MSVDWGFMHDGEEHEFTGVNGRISFSWDVPVEAIQAFVRQCFEYPDEPVASAYGRLSSGRWFVETYLLAKQITVVDLGLLRSAIRTGNFRQNVDVAVGSIDDLIDKLVADWGGSNE